MPSLFLILALSHLKPISYLTFFMKIYLDIIKYLFHERHEFWRKLLNNYTSLWWDQTCLIRDECWVYSKKSLYPSRYSDTEAAWWKPSVYQCYSPWFIFCCTRGIRTYLWAKVFRAHYSIWMEEKQSIWSLYNLQGVTLTLRIIIQENNTILAQP